MKTVSMGSGAMSWGDIPGPSIEMAQKADVQYIAFDFLAELTMSLLYRMKLRNPEAGYVPDLISFFKELMPIAKKRGIKLTSNGGGANPEQAGKELVKVAKEAGQDSKVQRYLKSEVVKLIKDLKI